MAGSSHWGPCPSSDDEGNQSGTLSLRSSLMDLTTAILQIFESKDLHFGAWVPLGTPERR